MAYITHRRADGAYQPLREHIYGVADRAETFAADFGAGEHARRAGLLHDIGKYSEAAQARQRDPEHTARVDHSTLGAQKAARMGDGYAAFCVAGHHGGLPDRGSAASREDGTLMARLKKTDLPSADAWKTEITVPDKAAVPSWLRGIPKGTQAFANALYTRMLFSALVDADYLDTEAYMAEGSVQRGRDMTPAQLLDRLEKYVAPWRKGTGSALNQKRTEILERCLHGAEDAPGLYTLTVPTGGGKTVSSLAFALSHAAAHGLRRVIYVVPYTSIIEQNAEVFRRIVGAENVLEHHANVEFDGEDQALRLATENWDAPMYDQPVAALRRTMAQHADIASPEAIHTYFDELMFIRGRPFLDQQDIMRLSDGPMFREIEAAFRLIDSQTIPVYLSVAEDQAELADLRQGLATRTTLRRLGRFAVHVYPQHFDRLIQAGVLEYPTGREYGILLDDRQYDAHCGLTMEPECGGMWFC